ncbi:MAG: chemotaxis protein CheB [Planctomycetaceae bacterium]|nr:chemotaxis protein CheB [Planctomycetaceae bacterium]
MTENEDAVYPNLLIVIGASAGGVSAITKIIKQLPSSFQGAILVATHRDPSQTNNMLKDVLDHNTRLRVCEPSEGEKIHCTTIYVGRNCDSIIVDGQEIHLDFVSDVERLKRIDYLFESAAIAGKNAVGVILSGMLWDGVEGLKAIHEAGGKCIVQDPEDALFPDMPRNALATIPVDYVGTTDEIASLLMELAAGRSCQ